MTSITWEDLDTRVQAVVDRALKAGFEVAALRQLPARTASTAPVSELEDATLIRLALSAGFDELYTHQTEALRAIASGSDVVVSTETSSGKSLVYQLGALQRILAAGQGRAIFVFPTKALAQDQLRRIQALAEPQGLKVAVYDGDTPFPHRARIRTSADLILTNPDMLHRSILPKYREWKRLFSELKVVALDEVHAYTGAFGTHVAHILRRLDRLAAWHGAEAQFIGTSATLRDPARTFSLLTGRHQCVAIETDGSGTAPKALISLVPPEMIPVMPTGRILGEMLVTASQQSFASLAFCGSRQSVENVMDHAQQGLRSQGLPSGWIESYRAGYTSEERRTIELAMMNGDARALVATNALELGINIGRLDAVILNGFPGRISSFWQQVGRSGRGGRPGCAIYLARRDALESLYAFQPELLRRERAEHTHLQVQNPIILPLQLACAAHERPLAAAELVDRYALPADSPATADLDHAKGVYVFPHHRSPAAKVSIRAVAADHVELVYDGRTLATMERWRALREAHTGASYWHRGRTFVVQKLDLERAVAMLEPDPEGLRSEPIMETDVQTLVNLQEVRAEKLAITLSTFRITTRVEGYRRFARDGQLMEEEPLNLPPWVMETVGIAVMGKNAAEVGSEEFWGWAEGWHAVQHALLTTAPMIASTDTRDFNWHWDVPGEASSFFRILGWDEAPGGLGFSETLYRHFADWWQSARQMVEGCPCERGCSRCLLTPRCECGNERLDKSWAKQWFALKAPAGGSSSAENGQ